MGIASDRSSLREALIEHILHPTQEAEEEEELVAAPELPHSLLSTPADCDALSITYHAELVGLCRTHAARLGVSRVRVQKVEHAALEVAYSYCGDKDGACRISLLRVPFAPPLRNLSDLAEGMHALRQSALSPPVHLLLTQPLAWAAIGGMVALGGACWVEGPRVCDVLLMPVGGRASGKFIFACAVLAHAAEALFALSVCKQLRMGMRAAASWALLVLLVGFPCLRWVLRLRPVAKAMSKMN